MARVLVATQPWGILWADDGAAASGGKKLKLPAPGVLAALNTTVYSAATGGGTVSPAAFVTDANGQLPGYVEQGSWVLTVSGTPFGVEALSGASMLAVESGDFAAGLTIIPAGGGAASTMVGVMDGTGGGGRYISGMSVQTSLGSNGVRGDSITSDTPNGNDSSQYAGYFLDASTLGTTAFDDKGSLLGVDSVVAIDPYSGGGDVYGEAAALYGVVYSRRKGALTAILEGLNKIDPAKPARAVGVRVVMQEDNELADYTTGIFGVSSPWVRSGARGLEVNSAGTEKLGTGLQFIGAGGFEYLMDWFDGSRSIFNVSGLGTISINTTTTQNALGVLQGADTQYRTAINTDGSINFGSGTAATDVALLWASAQVLRCTQNFQVLGYLYAQSQLLFGAAQTAGSMANNSVFVNTADGKLTFKDSGGTSHALY